MTSPTSEGPDGPDHTVDAAVDTPQSDDGGTSPHPRRRVWLAIGASQLALALVTVLGVVLAYNHLNGNIAAGEQINHKVDKSAISKGSLNILVMGSDSRAGKGNDIDGKGGAIGERSDTTILLHVSDDRRKAYGVSLPRDAIVDRPDCTTDDGKNIPGADDVMFNEAFSIGGPQCTVQMVESLTKLHIDHFVVLDFNGFKDMVDAVDGVEVCIPEDVDDDEHNIHLDAGTQTLEGQDALNYVRERYILSVTGDIGRMKRQQAFIASMVNKVLSAGTLSQPSKVYGFLNAATSSIKVDDGIDSVGSLVDLAMQFKNTGLDKINFVTVPIAEYPEDPNRLIWTDDAKGLWKRIERDEALGKEFASQSIGADDPVGGKQSGDGGSTGGGGSKDNDDLGADERTAAGLCA